MPKHLWRDECDTYVAHDAAELHTLRAENSESDDEDWERVDDDERVGIYEDEERTKLVTKTAREWADENPVGFLCSTEL